MKPLLFSISLILFLTSVRAQNLAWAKQFAGVTASRGEDIVVDAAGNVYTTGALFGTVDFDPGPGVFNLTQSGGSGAYISKLDANGNFLWAKQFESWNIVSYSIALDATGNVYTTGFFQQIADFDPGPGVYNLTSGSLGSDVFVCKLDNNGMFVWAKQLGGINNIYLGAFDLVIDGAGNAITTGNFSGTADFDPGPGIFNLTPAGSDDCFISKLDPNGNFVWAKKISGNSFEEGRGITVDATGNIYSTGFFQGTADFDPGPAIYNLTSSAPGNPDFYVSKFDQNGNFIWAKQVAGAIQGWGNSIAVDPTGNVFTTGYFRGTADFDPGPANYNLTATGGIDIYLLKLDGSGSFVWVRQIGGTGDDNGNKLSLDPSGNIYLTGYFENTVDFDPGPSNLNFTSAGNFDAFITKFDNAGTLILAKQVGGAAMDMGFSVASSLSGNIYATGFFINTADFDPGPAVYNLFATNQDAFVLKLSSCSNITTSSFTITSCSAYTLNGQTYTASGTYTQTLLNNVGCDSIITLHLTIGGSVTNSEVIACDNYTWEGQVLTSTGFYSVTYTAADGCDSVLNLNLTIKNRVLTTYSISICQGQVYAGHTNSGTYIDTYSASNGCDSIRTLHLTVNPKSISTINAIICEGQNYAGYSVPGSYTDIFTGANGCDSIRTLNLTVNPKKFTAISAAICQGQSYFAGGHNQTSPGIYKDTLSTSFGCDSIVTTTLSVNENPLPNLGPNRNLCAGSSITLNPGIFNSYLWQDMSSFPTFNANSTGIFWVTVTNSQNCSATDTFIIPAIKPLPAGFLKSTDSVCSYEKLILHPLNNYLSYLWSTGSTQNNISIQVPGQYWLRVTDTEGCTGVDTIKIVPKQCITGVFIPTAFTPNGDQKNDFFKAIIHGAVTNFRLEVYDRAGQLVFKTTDPLMGWNGQYGGIISSNAVFVWQCFYQLNGAKPTYQKGTVTVIK
jgi:gliding motility-associated-like protein